VKAQAIASVPIFTSGRISHSINAAEASLQAAQHNEVSSVLNIKMQCRKPMLQSCAGKEHCRLRKAMPIA
jgi:hypothetical protein